MADSPTAGAGAGVSSSSQLSKVSASAASAKAPAAPPPCAAEAETPGLKFRVPRAAGPRPGGPSRAAPPSQLAWAGGGASAAAAAASLLWRRGRPEPLARPQSQLGGAAANAVPWGVPYFMLILIW